MPSQANDLASARNHGRKGETSWPALMTVEQFPIIKAVMRANDGLAFASGFFTFGLD